MIEYVFIFAKERINNKTMSNNLTNMIKPKITVEVTSKRPSLRLGIAS